MSRRNEISIRELAAPATYQAENAVLGALVCNPQYLADARDVIGTEDFSDPENARLWDTLLALYDNGDTITMARVIATANAKHFTDNILPHCAGDLGLVDVFAHVRDLADTALRRRLYFDLSHALQNASAGETAEAVAEARALVERINAREDSKDTRSVGDAINDLAEDIERTQRDKAEGKVLRVPTSFPTLDGMTYGGFARGNLVILAARPTVGKTAVALQMARTAAGQGIPVYFSSLEMTTAELVQRLIRSRGSVNGWQIANGEVDWTEYENASRPFATMPLYLNDKAAYLDDICNKIATAARRGQCAAAFIDYLGLIDYREKGDTNKLVGQATKRLKRLAKQLGIPVVLLCQLNRDSSKEGRAPELYDLRDSGAIEQDADVVLMMQKGTGADGGDIVEMYVRKNRQNAANALIRLAPSQGYTTFTEIDDAI